MPCLCLRNDVHAEILYMFNRSLCKAVLEKYIEAIKYTGITAV